METTVELCPSVADDGQCEAETRVPNAAQGQVGVDPGVLSVEEPSATGLTSPSGGRMMRVTPWMCWAMKGHGP